MSRPTATSNTEAQREAVEALAELKRRGRQMSDAEREVYIRRAMQVLDPGLLADRLIARVPGLVDPSTTENLARTEDPAQTEGPEPTDE